jgi:hypothetical protein
MYFCFDLYYEVPVGVSNSAWLQLCFQPRYAPRPLVFIGASSGVDLRWSLVQYIQPCRDSRAEREEVYPLLRMPMLRADP